MLIQEEIAWGRALDDETQLHILSCKECTQVSLEFTKLDSAFAEKAFSQIDVQISDDFADRVMRKIEKENSTAASFLDFAETAITRFAQKLGSFFQLRPVQVTFALWIAFSMSRAF